MKPKSVYEYSGTTSEFLNAADPIDEYRNHPLIGSLGPVLSNTEILKRLVRLPKLPADIDKMPKHLQTHIVRAMSTLFIPTQSQIDAIMEIEIQIRRGYLGRNPLNSEYRRLWLQDMRELRLGREIPERHKNVGGGAVIGPPGTGKTSILIELESWYGTRIQHCYDIDDSRLAFIQVPTVHLRLFADASLRALGVEFFHELAKLTGIDAVRQRANGLNGNLVQPEIYTAIREFHLGLVVVDDSQNMASHNRGFRNVLSYFVRLMNSTGVPVILIGTQDTQNYINQDESVRRRYSSPIPQFQALAAPSPVGKGKGLFELLLERFPFYNTRCGNSERLSIQQTIHSASGGIPDLIVKLCMYIQARILSEPTAEMNGKFARSCATDLLSHFDTRVLELGSKRRRKNDLESVAKITNIAFEEKLKGALNSRSPELEVSQEMDIEDASDPLPTSDRADATQRSVDEELKILEQENCLETFE